MTYHAFTPDMLHHAVTLTFDPLIINICSLLAGKGSNTVINVTEIKQFAVAL